MASTIKLKNSATAGNTPSSLETGEVAINVTDGNLFYGSASAVLQNFVINELEVKGNLTAQQYTISSSVTNVTFQQQSGSTIFGDTLDDTHLFTGSINVTGSVVSNGVTLTGDQDLSSLATIAQLNASSSTLQTNIDAKASLAQLNASSSALQTNIDTKVDTSGTPADNQIAIFTDADTIEGTSELTYDGTTLNIDGQVDIDEARSSGAVVDITNSYSGLMSADHFALRVVGGQANSTPGSQVKAYGGHFTAGNTNAQNPDSIALFAQGHEDGAPNSYAAIFSGSAGGIVGINTMEPTVELDVVGDIKVSNNITASGDISSSGTITGNSIVGTLATAAQTNITSVGTLGSLTLGGDINTDGNNINMNAGEITDAAAIRSLQFGSTTDADLTITSDGNITFKLDDDNDETGQSFSFKNDNTEIANLDESGNLQLDGNITASGNISSSGDIFCNNITIAEDITSVGDDIILKDNLLISSSAGAINFRGTAGGSNESITYLDSGGTGRFAMLFPGSDVVAITNRASNGTVQIRANSSTAGSGGEVTVATFEDDLIKLDVPQRRLVEVSTTTDGNGNGDFIKLGSTSTTAGKIYYYNSSGNWVETDADAASSSTGLIAVAMSNNSNKGMMLKGMVTLDHDPGTVGDVLYLSTTAGEATSTAPSATGDVVRVIGYCLDSTNGQIYFDPSKDHIVHA